MKKKILLFAIGLVLISVLITSVISSNTSINSLMEAKNDELETYCRLINQSIADDYGNGLEPDLSHYADTYGKQLGMRVTIVNADGQVFGDSEEGTDYRQMENHKDRQEIQEALKEGIGISSRDSDTLGGGYLYVAVAENIEGHASLITRVAVEVDRLSLISEFILRATLISALLGIFAAAGIALSCAGSIIRPIETIVEGSAEIAKGNYHHRIEVRTRDELETLAGSINNMAGELAVSVEEMKRADNIRREFVANVTHELKTPLTSISGFVETLQDGAADNPEIRRKFLDIIAVEASRLKRLIDDILVISDIESGRELNTDRDLNVCEAVDEVIASIQPQIEKKRIRVETHYAYEIYIGGNRDRFKQMMMNLVENAVKYSEEGGRVTVSAEKRDGKAILRVRDEGIGIAEENLPRLFERFYRVDKSRSQKAGGTGLGLAIVKHIAGLFGGEVTVESQLGKGSTFTVILPE